MKKKLLNELLENADAKRFNFMSDVIDEAFSEAKKFSYKVEEILYNEKQVNFYKFEAKNNGKLNVFAYLFKAKNKKVNLYVFDCDGLLISKTNHNYNQALCHSIDVLKESEYLIAIEADKGEDVRFQLTVKNYKNQEDYMENVEKNDLDDDYKIDVDDYKFWGFDKNFEHRDEGIMVVELERILFKLRYIEELDKNGYFGRTLKYALEDFKGDYGVRSDNGEVNNNVREALKTAIMAERNLISIENAFLQEPTDGRGDFYKKFTVTLKNESDIYSIKDLRIIIEDEDGTEITTKKINKIKKNKEEMYNAIIIKSDLPKISGKNRFKIKIVSNDFEKIEFDSKKIDVRLFGVDYDALKKMGEDIFDFIGTEIWKKKIDEIVKGLTICKDKDLKEYTVKENEIWVDPLKTLTSMFSKKVGNDTDCGILGLVLSLEAGAIFGVNVGSGIYIDRDGEWSKTLEGKFVIESNVGAGLCIGLVYYPFLKDLKEVQGFSIEMEVNFDLNESLGLGVSINQCRPETLGIAVSFSTPNSSILSRDVKIKTGYAIEVDNSKYDDMIVLGDMTKREWRDFMYNDIWQHSKM